MVAQDKIIKKLEEIKHWRDVYHRPTATDVVIQNTSYDAKLQQCAIYLSFKKNGNPEKKKVTFHESNLFDRLESDFEYDNSPVEIGREIVKPVLVEQKVVSAQVTVESPVVEVVESDAKRVKKMLFDTIDKLSAGTIDYRNALAIVAISQVIINQLVSEDKN